MFLFFQILFFPQGGKVEEAMLCVFILGVCFYE